MCEECAPYIPVSILIGCSVFGGSFVRFDDTDRNNILEVISMGSGLMLIDAAIYSRRVDLKMFLRSLSERWKSLEIEFLMMFLVPLMCC